MSLFIVQIFDSSSSLSLAVFTCSHRTFSVASTPLLSFQENIPLRLGGRFFWGDPKEQSSGWKSKCCNRTQSRHPITLLCLLGSLQRRRIESLICQSLVFWNQPQFQIVSVQKLFRSRDTLLFYWTWYSQVKLLNVYSESSVRTIGAIFSKTIAFEVSITLKVFVDR